MFPESLCLELCVGQSVTRSSEAEGGGGGNHEGRFSHLLLILIGSEEAHKASKQRRD